mmetsp:Transcript_8107/g.27195  ORF Transcript_8107/g.27195 Transcript_8107/m.27195 type:complete len:119 (+) Transcript_8107:4189-4545(+)
MKEIGSVDVLHSESETAYGRVGLLGLAERSFESRDLERYGKPREPCVESLNAIQAMSDGIRFERAETWKEYDSAKEQRCSHIRLLVGTLEIESAGSDEIGSDPAGRRGLVTFQKKRHS